MAKNASSTEVARGADVPLALSTAGPRDALTDPREGDIIPDLETKGLHVGHVAQPAEPVLHKGGRVEFESLPEAPESRFTAFAGSDLKALKEYHNKVEAKGIDGATEFVAPAPIDAAGNTVVEAAPASSSRSSARGGARSGAGSDSGEGSATSDLEADANRVANKQAREDSTDK